MDDAAGAATQPLEADRHGEPDRDLQGELGETAATHEHVAVVHEMANLEEAEQHREQDRGRVNRARGRVVGALAQQMAADPEGQRRHAVAVEQPVEDRRRADVAADDARLPADAREHQRRDSGREPAQHRQRTLRRDPGDAGDHQGEGDREPALFEREGHRERERRDRAGGINRLRGSAAGTRRAPGERFGRDREQRGEHQGETREGNRSLPAGDPIIERDQDRDRGERARCRPQDRNERAFRPPLRQEAGGAEQEREEGAQREVEAGIGQVRIRNGARARTARQNEPLDDRLDRPGNHDQRREPGRGRNRCRRRIAAPGDRDRGGRQGAEHDQRERVVAPGEHENRGGQHIGGERAGGDRVDPVRLGRRTVEQSGDDQQRREPETRHRMECVRRERRHAQVMDAGEHPCHAEADPHDREPAPQADAGEPERGGRDDREIDIERPVVRPIGGDQQRRDLGAHEAERREGWPVQQGSEERRERDHTEQHEGERRIEKPVERIGRIDRRVADGGAGRRQDARNMRRRQSGQAGDLLHAARPFAGTDQRGRQQGCEEYLDARADQILLDRIAHQEEAAEREREPADPHHPACPEPLLESDRRLGRAGRGRCSVLRRTRWRRGGSRRHRRRYGCGRRRCRFRPRLRRQRSPIAGRLGCRRGRGLRHPALQRHEAQVERARAVARPDGNHKRRDGSDRKRQRDENQDR